MLTHEEAKNIILNHTEGVTGFDTSTYPGRTDTPWEGLRCPKGHNIAPRLHAIQSRPERGICSHTECGGKRALTHEEAVARIHAMAPDMRITTPYPGALKNWAMECPTHGKIQTKLGNVGDGLRHPCRKCGLWNSEKPAVVYGLVGVLNDELVIKVGVTTNLKGRLYSHASNGFTTPPFMVVPTMGWRAREIENVVATYMGGEGYVVLGEAVKDLHGGYEFEAWSANHLLPHEIVEVCNSIEELVIEEAGAQAYIEYLYTADPTALYEAAEKVEQERIALAA